MSEHDGEVPPTQPTPQYSAPQYPPDQYPAPPFLAPQYPGQPYPGPPFPAPQYPGQPYSGPPFSAVPYQAGPPGAYPPGIQYPPAGWYQPQPPPPGRNQTGWIVAAVAAVVLVVVACGVGGVIFIARLGNATHPTAGAGTAPSRNPGATTQPAKSSHPGELASYLLTPPSDSRPWKTKPTNDLYDLDATAALGSNPTVRAGLLRRYGFQQAAVVRWISSVNSIVELRLYRFDSESHATDFMVADRIANEDSSWGKATDLAGVADAIDYVQSTPDENGNIETLAMARRGDLVAALFNTQYAPPEKTETAKILNEQCAKL